MYVRDEWLDGWMNDECKFKQVVYYPLASIMSYAVITGQPYGILQYNTVIFGSSVLVLFLSRNPACLQDVNHILDNPYVMLVLTINSDSISIILQKKLGHLSIGL